MATITKRDCLDLLFDLKEGVEDTSEINQEIMRLIQMGEPDSQTIKFINDRRELGLRLFYEKLRFNYNAKKSSKLYKNIVRCEELEPKEILTCLGSLQLQILLFYTKEELEGTNFLTHSRFDSIQQCLMHFYKTGDIIPGQKLLALIKADLKLLEEISK